MKFHYEVTLEFDDRGRADLSDAEVREYCRISFADFGARFVATTRGLSGCRVESIEPGPRRWSKSAPTRLNRLADFLQWEPLDVVFALLMALVAGLSVGILLKL